jgi:hypothetical protein
VAFTAVYEANVLHPASTRDLLVRLGNTGLFQARWTEAILDEMVDSVLERRPDLTGAQLERTRQLMCEAVPDCLVTGYQSLVAGLELPDPNDRHVLAAAMRCHAQVIVTDNHSDFPDEDLGPYMIEAQSCDDFVFHLVDLAPATFAATVQRQADVLTNPAQTLDELVDRLRRNGLARAMAALEAHLSRESQEHWSPAMQPTGGAGQPKEDRWVTSMSGSAHPAGRALGGDETPPSAAGL